MSKEEETKEVAKKTKGEVAKVDFAQFGNAGLEHIDHAKRYEATLV